MIKGFKTLELGDIDAEMAKILEKGYDTGMYCGFPSFQDHYSMLPGACTDWIGYPGHGKTELMLEMLFNMTDFYEWNHLLFVPDIGKSIDVMIKLIHKETGLSFKKKHPNFIGHEMDVKKVFAKCTRLMRHFTIIHRTDYKQKITPVELWEYAAAYRKERGDHSLHTVCIDSWKDLHHDYQAHGGNYAPYLSHILPIRNEIAERSGLHFHTVIHPKNPQRTKNMTLCPPYPDDMEGGAQWNNSGKCIIATHREDYDDGLTYVYFRKIKPESVGRATSQAVVLGFDIVKSRYYWNDGNGQKVYSEKEIRPIYDSAMKANVDFTVSKREEQNDMPF